MSSGSARKRWPVVAGAVFFVLGSGVGLLMADRRVVQPYVFNHTVHTAKADCTLCHRGARDGVRAGLPSIEVCTGCHARAPGASASSADEALWAGALRSSTSARPAAEPAAEPEESGPASPIYWQRLWRLPRHVYFSHRRHTTAGGIACESCHGPMGEQRRPPEHPLIKLKMRQCIECHEQKQVTADCTACHR